MEFKVTEEKGYRSYVMQGTMPMDRAKIESLQAIANQLERLNDTLAKIEEHITYIDETLRNKLKK